MINGEKIRELMKECGIDAKELAQTVGVSEAMISYIINGLRDTNVTTLVRIAHTLGCKVDSLIKA